MFYQFELYIKISNTVELGHLKMGLLKGTIHKNMLQVHGQNTLERFCAVWFYLDWNAFLF